MEKLKTYFKKYEDPRNVNNVMKANLEIEGVRLEMGKNIQNMVNNVGNLNELDGKSQKLKEGSEMFNKDARELESVTWWKNCKLTVIIVVIIIAIILCIAIPLAVKSGSSSNNSNNSGGTTTNTTKLLF